MSNDGFVDVDPKHPSDAFEIQKPVADSITPKRCVCSASPAAQMLFLNTVLGSPLLSGSCPSSKNVKFTDFGSCRWLLSDGCIIIDKGHNWILVRVLSPPYHTLPFVSAFRRTYPSKAVICPIPLPRCRFYDMPVAVKCFNDVKSNQP
uniref:Uncharacterized protein n=1 Tax=Panagrellus redivivus TaxID=6233 RepID=A0A7E4ZZU0_PANRE